MTTHPANSEQSPVTETTPALGGPLPPLRILLVNGNGRGRRTALGFLLHTAAVAVLFTFPVLLTEKIVANPPSVTGITYPVAKGNPKGSGLRPQPSGPKQSGTEQPKPRRLALPDAHVKPTGVGPVVTAGLNGGLDNLGLPDGFDIGVPVASPDRGFHKLFAPEQVLQQPVPIVRGGKVRPPKLLRRVEPAYPPLAKQASIQGTVVLEATLGTDGRVEHIQVVSGHPLLVEPAQQAVAQWLYEPSYLNGRPVAVLLHVTVEFILRR